MRSALRALGWIAAGLAAVLLTYDLIRLIQTGGFGPIAFGELWFMLHPTSLQLAEPAVSRYLHPFLWHPVIVTVLTAPAFVVFGVLAALLFLGGRRPKRRARIFGSD